MRAVEARVKWGEGRGLKPGLWREVLAFGGGVSRRQFVALMLVWLSLGLGLLVLLTGGVAWTGAGGSITAFALREGAGFGERVWQWFVWAGVSGVVIRRCNDAGWGRLLVLLVLALLLLSPLIFLPLVSLVLGVTPSRGFAARWDYLLEQGRRERAEGRERGRPVVSGAVVEGSGVSVVEPVVEGPPLESVEDMREWLYGGGDE